MFGSLFVKNPNLNLCILLLNRHPGVLHSLNREMAEAMAEVDVEVAEAEAEVEVAEEEHMIQRPVEVVCMYMWISIFPMVPVRGTPTYL